MTTAIKREQDKKSICPSTKEKKKGSEPTFGSGGFRLDMSQCLLDLVITFGGCAAGGGGGWRAGGGCAGGGLLLVEDHSRRHRLLRLDLCFARRHPLWTLGDIALTGHRLARLANTPRTGNNSKGIKLYTFGDCG